jgi:hypothetical protein
MSLSVCEFAVPSILGAVQIPYQAASMPPLASSNVTIGASSAQSPVFGAQTALIRVCADEACRVEVGGTNPTAGATSMYVAAGVPEYFAVTPGARLAVIEVA